jgi:GTPase SAR1 family protein
MNNIPALPYRPVVLLAGESNSGKSSFLNAFAGNYISNSSIQRETLQPSLYNFSNNGTLATVVAVQGKLEAIHADNQSARLLPEKLADEQFIGKTQIMTEGDEKWRMLPLARSHLLADLDIVDLPGINEAGDKVGCFFKALESWIPKADTIIYIADAARGFQYESDVANFKRVQSLVTAENDRGHYLELIVVMNKYDSADDRDLGEIFSRIPALINLPRENLFRCSSHKMIINTVLQGKSEFMVPKFARDEIKRILKSAAVNVSRAVKERIKRDGLIRHGDIEYQETIDSDFSDDDDVVEGAAPGGAKYPVPSQNNTGDWDGVLQWLQKSQREMPLNVAETVKEQIKKWSDACTKLPSDQVAISDASNKINQYVVPLCNEFERIRDIARHKEVNLQMFRNSLVKITQWIIKERRYSVAMYMIAPILYWCEDNLTDYKSILETVEENVKDFELPNRLELHIGERNNRDFGLHSLTTIFFTAIESQYKILSRYILIAILKHPEAYGQSIHVTHYCAKSKKVVVRSHNHVADNSYGSHRSWIVERILNCEHPEWRLIMKLALTPSAILLAYDRNREISYSFCDKYLCKDYLGMLRFYLNLIETRMYHGKKIRECNNTIITSILSMTDGLDQTFFNLIDDADVKRYMAERKLFREQFVAKLDTADRM